MAGRNNGIIDPPIDNLLGKLDLQAIYKYRSDYYQDFVGGGSQLRYVHGAGTVDLRGSYAITPNARVQIEAVNITDEPRIEDMPVWGSVRGYYAYGAKYYASLRYRF